MGTSLASIYDNVSYALNLHMQAIAQLQEEAATGNRVNRASDSPSDSYRILELNTQDRKLGTYKDNISNLVSTLQISSTVMENMASSLASTQTVLTQIVGGVYNEDGQKRIADEIDNTLNEIVSLANTQHAGQYLFGGNNSTKPPYLVQRQNGVITSVTYQGSEAARSVDVAPDLEVGSNSPGNDIFQTHDRQTPVFLGSTGAKAGTGTSNVTGDVWLTVEQDGSGYKISIDDGATFVPVASGGDANQAVTDSRTGRVLYVDTTGINSTGVELVRVPGTYDVFGALISLRDMLLNSKGLSTQQLLNYVDEAAKSVDEIHNQLVQADVSIGSKIGFLTTLSSTLDGMQSNTKDEAAQLQQADISQISIDLSRRQILYQMSLAAAGKVMTTSLLDFIGTSG